MIHPDTCLRYINDQIGYGVFATRHIPKGTITYVKDSLELEISSEEYQRHIPEMQAIIEKYSYIDENGIRIVSWDFAKYVNHCCDSNTLSTGYVFDIAIRDIQPGEEINCDYGVLNLIEEMPLVCKHPGCRGFVRPSDFETFVEEWDKKLKAAFIRFPNVNQPLLPFIDGDTREKLYAFFDNEQKYQSVLCLKYNGNISSHMQENNKVHSNGENNFLKH